jgi:hypothetical protein
MAKNPNSASHPKFQYQYSVRHFFVLVTVAGLAVAAVVGILSFIRNAQRAAQRMAAQSPLNQLVLALHNYHEQFGTFPPAYTVDEKGMPMHSWRALILPYVEERVLYAKIDFSEPWNGPNNSKLLHQMPRIFCSPTEPHSDRYTNILAFAGPGTAFPPNSAVALSDVIDGAENTLLLGEISNSDVLWLEPRDFEVGERPVRVGAANIAKESTAGKPPEPSVISAVHWRLPYVVFADSIHAYSVRLDTPTEALQALTTIAGDEAVTRQQLIDEGFLR